jgi:predicted HTH domain antitoxin
MVLNESIVRQVPYFNTLQEKEIFLNVIGALSVKIISLSKACEVLKLNKNTLLQILDAIGFDYSYLTEADIKDEREW